MRAHRRERRAEFHGRARAASKLGQVPPLHRPGSAHRVQHRQLRLPVPHQPRRDARGGGLPLLGPHDRQQASHERHDVQQQGVRHPRQQGDHHRGSRAVRPSPGGAARPQALVLLPQRRLRALPRRAEGGRASLRHLGAPGGHRRDAPSPRGVLPEGRVPAPAAPGQTDVHVQLHRDGARHGRPALVPPLPRAVHQGHVADSAQGGGARHARPAHAEEGRRRAVGGWSGVRRRHRARRQGGVLRAPHRHVGFRVAVPVHHDGPQPVLLHPRAGQRRVAHGAGGHQQISHRRRVRQGEQDQGNPAGDFGGAPLGAQARKGGSEKGAGSAREGGAGRPPARAQGERQLRVRLHGRYRGSAALPGDLVEHDVVRYVAPKRLDAAPRDEPPQKILGTIF